MILRRRSPDGPRLTANRDFVVIWAGAGVSELGTSMSLLVFPLVGYAITHSTIQAGLATTGLILGNVLLRLPAGALVDRIARSRVLLLTNIAGALVYASLATALLLGHLTLGHLIVAGFLSGAAEAFAAPATSAAMRTIVAKPQLPLAYTRLEARDNAVQLVGPPLGGALYSLARGVPFLVDAVSYAVEAFAVTRIRTPLPAPARTAASSVRADVAEGLRFVWDHVGVRSMMIWGGLVNFCGGFVFVAVTLRLIRAGAHPAAIGLVSTATAAAGLLGALVAPAIVTRAPTGLVAIVLTVVHGALIVPIAWTSNVAATGAFLAVGTFLVPANNAGISAYFVSIVPDALQGRVNSAAGFISTGISPFGPLLAGVALASFGGRTTLLLGGVLTAASVIPLVASRTVRTLAAGIPGRTSSTDVLRATCAGNVVTAPPSARGSSGTEGRGPTSPRWASVSPEHAASSESHGRSPASRCCHRQASTHMSSTVYVVRQLSSRSARPGSASDDAISPARRGPTSYGIGRFAARSKAWISSRTLTPVPEPRFHVVIVSVVTHRRSRAARCPNATSSTWM